MRNQDQSSISLWSFQRGTRIKVQFLFGRSKEEPGSKFNFSLVVPKRNQDQSSIDTWVFHFFVRGPQQQHRISSLVLLTHKLSKSHLLLLHPTPLKPKKFVPMRSQGQSSIVSWVVPKRNQDQSSNASWVFHFFVRRKVTTATTSDLFACLTHKLSKNHLLRGRGAGPPDDKYMFYTCTLLYLRWHQTLQHSPPQQHEDV
ncbi:hypothetical protein AVEN_64736-1 [Araneus ventricosus]|uniref:Uncharacterized protein n=1 Tax=Araneus ventricosus TaxID=182803 RepID=A0A4Y1ZYF5_ARAVE|nr:hypothetical protein AVEN_64736-1 [Araneus ventricosus]